jgi:intracellular sulfur oxidation DsrE/DsrF family protein
MMNAIVHIDSDKASTAFRKLRNSLNDDKFLKAKLLQHSRGVTGPKKDLLLEYIREL